ncbi:MAG: helix-turn-helix domain-containing protein [Nitrospinae bacterium]|nr:helix-turn-helix domain-containing protein [Nitrospinota bacterium]
MNQSHFLPKQEKSMSRPKRSKPKNEIKIEDNSEDKEYFTIVPNYILNHSSVYDRAVYIEMKRIAGESGKCWAGLKTLSERTKMSIGQVKNSLDYLLKRRWIKKVGVYNQ